MEGNEDGVLARIREQYPPILTTAQVAELLDLNPRTVLLMAGDGRLPASRLPVSRKFHFFLEDVLDTLQSTRSFRRRAGPTRPRRPDATAAGRSVVRCRSRTGTSMT